MNTPLALWDVESCVRCVGGAALDTSSLPDGAKRVPKGTPIAFDSDSQKAKVVKTIRTLADAAAGATSLEVEKGSLFKVGDTIAGSTISAIDDSAEDKDVLTISALETAIEAGVVIDDGNGASVVGLCYADTKIDEFPSVTWTIQAYEINEYVLPYPLTGEIKEALTSRHHFAAF